VIVALTACVGYAVGTYHYQIEAAVAPIFGRQARAGVLDLGSLQQTYNVLASNYDGQLDTEKLIEGANRGMVNATGDAYTVYMNARERAEFDKDLSGNIGAGIGAEIGVRNDKITIIRTLKNNAAEKAGLLANDIIMSVNDQSTSGWTVEHAVSKIRGEEGTTVKLSIMRGTETKEYSITRATIDNPSVESSTTDGIGTMTISRFDSETGTLARLAAQDFVTQKAKGVILDLRGNGGGYVDAAQDVAGLWLDNQVVVTERTGSVIKSTLKSGNNALLKDIPTVVLVNGVSASASEIVSGALQDYKVAKLVGETTFGKGSVQKLISLSAGAQLKVTVARWYTPNGKNISMKGIKPDVEIGMTQQDVNNGIDTQLNKAKELLAQ
jgi:carboxyl-terminal processing protease